jgi:hypothetical protein
VKKNALKIFGKYCKKINPPKRRAKCNTIFNKELPAKLKIADGSEKQLSGELECEKKIFFIPLKFNLKRGIYGIFGKNKSTSRD